MMQEVQLKIKIILTIKKTHYSMFHPNKFVRWGKKLICETDCTGFFENFCMILIFN